MTPLIKYYFSQKNSGFQMHRMPERCHGYHSVNHRSLRSESCSVHTHNDNLEDSLLHLNETLQSAGGPCELNQDCFGARNLY